MEVTKEHELVWEYVSPYWGTLFPLPNIYRAYRYPYDYVPQLPHPQEVAVEPLDIYHFQVPGAAPVDILDEITVMVEGTEGYGETDGFCVQTEKAETEEEDEYGGMTTTI